jgi:outer membrane receptor protein involved in Fe transport
MRYVGAAPLVENNSVQSNSTLTTNLHISRHVDTNLDVSLDVLNLTNRANHDISYYYASRSVGMLTSQEGTHIHPAEPRTFRVNARLRY